MHNTLSLAFTHIKHTNTFIIACLFKDLLLTDRSFGAKDEIFCLFQGSLDNLGSLKQQYGLAKNANEVLLVIEAYKTLRDRAPYPANHVVAHLSGDFAFVVFDKSTSTLFVASDQVGKVPLYWGITADGYVAFADDVDLLKGACGKSLASFPQGCYYSTALGGLRSFENPKNKITAVPANEGEIWGATFKVIDSSKLNHILVFLFSNI
ncbi:putative nucleophile aminohydrolase [Arabidopsis thaliana]